MEAWLSTGCKSEGQGMLQLRWTAHMKGAGAGGGGGGGGILERDNLGSGKALKVCSLHHHWNCLPHRLMRLQNAASGISKSSHRKGVIEI